MGIMDSTYNNKQQTWSRWIFLGLLSMALSSFVPMSIFAPAPLAIAYLIYGRKMGLILSVMGGGTFAVMSALTGTSPMLVALYFVSAFYAVLVAEIILRKVEPVKGLIKTGGFIIGIIVLLFGLMDMMGEASISSLVDDIVNSFITKIKTDNSELLAGGTEQARVIKSYIEHPEDITKEILAWIPSMLFITVFLTLWTSLFLVLRNSTQWRSFVKYPFSTRSLSRFKVPDYFVYPLIVSLALTLGGEYLGVGELGVSIGANLLYCLGVFYFFQGFGIYLDFLNFLKIIGIMRSLLVLMTIMMAWKLLVFVGIFDMWINFRKFLKRKDINEGDKS